MYTVFYFLRNVMLTIFSFIKVIFSIKYIPTFNKIDNENNIFILGNGPSLKINLERDINFLMQRTVLCVNGFSLSPEFKMIKPKYYLLADDAFWKNNYSEDVNNFVSNVLESIVSTTSWPMKMFIPFKAKKNKQFINKLKKNKFINISYYNSNTIKGFVKINHLLFKYNLGMPSTQNVLIPSLMIAINLKYSKIYLLGADHSWHENYIVNENNIVCIKDAHFYDPNPVYKPLLNEGKPIRLHELFESLAKAFQTYHIIKHYADFQKVEVYNTSEKSYIDAFPRVKLNDIK